MDLIAKTGAADNVVVLNMVAMTQMDHAFQGVILVIKEINVTEVRTRINEPF